MQYIQYRPLTKQLLNTVKSIIHKYFPIYLSQKNSVLDLCCGKGGFTISLKSYTNIYYVVGVDNNINNIKTFTRYLSSKNIKYKLFCLDVFKLKYNYIFDIILIDPPFKFNLCSKILQHLYLKKFVSTQTLIIMRNLYHNHLIVDENTYNIYYNIKIGNNQLVFIKVKQE